MTIPASDIRFWHQLILRDWNSRPYRISFRVAEEGTWDHRFHDLDGTEINPEDLWLMPHDYLKIQSMCDAGAGSACVADFASQASRVSAQKKDRPGAGEGKRPDEIYIDPVCA